MRRMTVRVLLRVGLPPRVRVRDRGLPAIVLQFGCWVLLQRPGNFLQKLSISVRSCLARVRSNNQTFLFLVKRDTWSVKGSGLVAEKQTNDKVVRTFVTT